MKTSGTIKTETRAIGALIPFARNSRTHSDEQVAQIAASIREFGWTNPILVDGDNGIIAGEMTCRSIHAIELNPAYVDVAVKRWQDFTGQQAIHEATGKTFAEMADNLPTQPDTAREQVEEVS